MHMALCIICVIILIDMHKTLPTHCSLVMVPHPQLRMKDKE
jgi:hypothetical protein